MSGIHTYKVIEIIQNKYGVQYVLEDQGCNHGWKCQLLTQYDDDNNLKFICMVNDDDEDSQSYWHKPCGVEYFFEDDLSKAYRVKLQESVTEMENQIEKTKSSLKALIEQHSLKKEALLDANSVMEYLKKYKSYH